MNKLTIVFLLAVTAFISCGSNEPIVYTSIAGAWKCEEFRPYSGTPRRYIVDITRKRSDTTQYALSNFYDVDINEFVWATLRNNVLTLNEPAQPIGFSGISVKSGKGTVSSDFRRIDFEYSIFDGTNDVTIKNVVYSR
jgi:hypothetical protein